MIDTIKLVVRDFEIDQRTLMKRPSVQRMAYGTRSTIFKRLPDDGFTLSVFESSGHGKTSRGITIETSAPKFIFGSNLFEVSDDHLSLFTNKLASKLVGFGIQTSAESIANSKLNRLDFCRNVPFIGDSSSYIDSVAKIAKGYKTSTEVDRIKNIDRPDGHQLIVGNSSRRSSIYDKLTEAESNYANHEALEAFRSQFPDHGLIRIEHSLQNALAVKRAMAVHGLEPTLKDAWSAELSAKILRGIFSEVFNNGTTPDQTFFANSKFDLETEALMNRVKVDGLVKTLNDLKRSVSSARYYRLQNNLSRRLRDPPLTRLDPNQISNYLKNFDPILKTPICAPLTVHSINL